MSSTVVDNNTGVGGGKDDDHTSGSVTPPTATSSIVDDEEVANNKLIQYHEDMNRAARNSIEGNVGAYSVVPGRLPSRREAGDDDISGLE